MLTVSPRATTEKREVIANKQINKINEILKNIYLIQKRAGK